MNRYGWIVVLIAGLLSGCVSMETKRGVVNNKFYSSYPKLAIEVAPGFEYIDNQKSSDFGFYVNRMTGTRHSQDRYIFGDRLNKTILNITITRLNEGYWMPTLNTGITNLIDGGYEEHQGARYQYGVWTSENEDGDCVLIKRLGRIIGGEGNTLLKIVYVEPIKNNTANCAQWQKPSMLDDTQRVALNRFLDNWRANVKFISPSDVEPEE